MLQRNMDPATLGILPTNPEKFRLVRPVTVLDIFQNNTRDFHEDGLFSTTIFGKVGSEDRLTRMSYIDIHVPIFHPRIYNRLCSLKQLYKGIMSGREYAKWDDKAKDFVKVDNILDGGETGYHFFLSHWEELNFRRTNSKQRDERIVLVKKYSRVALTSKILVMPAGLRDLEVDEHGGIDQHEINDFYRSLIRIAATVSSVRDLNSPIIDKARFGLQLAFNELHDYIMTAVTKGKGSYFSTKFGRRKIKYGTRGVLAAVSTAVKHLDDPTNYLPTETQVGLFQSIKATEPMFIHHLNKIYLDRVFRGENSAWLIDAKTLDRVEVVIDPRTSDRWTTLEGITKLINTFENPDMRNNPIMVNKHYLGLIYKRDGRYKLIFDMSEIRPEHMDDKDYVTPLTYAELFFIACNRYIRELPSDITRYPIETANSIFPSYTYLMTNKDSLRMIELDDAWEDTKYVTTQFPNSDNDIWFDILGFSPGRVIGAGGDKL